MWDRLAAPSGAGCAAVLFLAALVCAPSARAAAPAREADCVLTPAGPLEGAVALRAEGLTVATRAVPWEDVLLIVRNVPPTVSTLRLLRLKSGELWNADVTGAAPGKLKIDGPVCGAQTLEARQIAALDFVRGLPPPVGEATKTLLRSQGEALPGEMLWLDREHCGYNTPLGALTLPLAGLQRYVYDLPAQPERPAGADEVCLTDGSVYLGKCALEDGKMQLQHALLGRIALPWDAIRYVLKDRPGLLYLRDLPAEGVENRPLPAYPPRSLAVGGRHLARGSSWLARRCVGGLEIGAGTTVRWPLGEARKHTLAAWWGSVQGAAGDLKIRLAVDGKPVWERVQTARQAPEWLRVDVPAGKELKLDVDFAPVVRYPAGLVLGDPYLKAEAER